MVINKSFTKTYDFLIISLCLIILFILSYLYIYLNSNKDTTGNNVIVTSDKRIDSDLDLDIDYFLFYEGIDIEFDKKVVLNNINLSVMVIDGREIENDFEILVSYKYKDLLDEKIVLKIGENKYRFLVVGIYEDDCLVNREVFYSNSRTIDILYSYLEVGYYKYVFTANNYSDINSKIDLLRSNGYKINIYDNENLIRINNLNMINDVLVLFIVVLAAIVWIFIISAIF